MQPANATRHDAPAGRRMSGPLGPIACAPPSRHGRPGPAGGGIYMRGKSIYSAAAGRVAPTGPGRGARGTKGKVA